MCCLLCCLTAVGGRYGVGSSIAQRIISTGKRLKYTGDRSLPLTLATEISMLLLGQPSDGPYIEGPQPQIPASVLFLCYTITM